MAKLEGMTQICDYIKRTDATVLSYIRQLGFPASKLGCIWISDTGKIDAWLDDLIENGNSKTPAPAKAKKKTKTAKRKKKGN